MCELETATTGHAVRPVGVEDERGVFSVDPANYELRVGLSLGLRETHVLVCHHGDEQWEVLDVGATKRAICPPGTFIKGIPRELIPEYVGEAA